MPKACIVYIKYKSGEAAVGVYRLTEDAVFGLKEMERWILEDDPEVESVSASKIPPHLEGALGRVCKQGS